MTLRSVLGDFFVVSSQIKYGTEGLSVAVKWIKLMFVGAASPVRVLVRVLALPCPWSSFLRMCQERQQRMRGVGVWPSAQAAAWASCVRCHGTGWSPCCSAAIAAAHPKRCDFGAVMVAYWLIFLWCWHGCHMGAGSGLGCSTSDPASWSGREARMIQALGPLHPHGRTRKRL